VQILDSLDEVRLSEDEIDVGRLLDGDGFQFHAQSPSV
jgi:hypothetical protein